MNETRTAEAVVRVDLGEARDVAETLLRSVGVTDEHARQTVASLLYADQCGIASHGLLRLPLYTSAVVQGGINARARMRWVADHGGAGLLDADGALGQAAMFTAIDYVLRHIDTHPTITVAVQGSSHYGAGAFWSDMLSDHGLIAVISSTTGPTVAPFGGREKVLGTNPLTIALPIAPGERLTADMATSTGAYGKVIAARNAGGALPEGWALDVSGSPTVDPAAAMLGSLTAFGGHKGSAIAVALEGLSAALGSSTFAFETVDIWANPASRMNVGHVLIAINPAFFAGVEHTTQRVTTLRERVRASGRGRPVHAPGDIESENLARNQEGVTLSRSTISGINDLAREYGTPQLRTEG